MNSTQALTQSGSHIRRPSASPRWRRAGLWTLGSFAGLLALGWLGLQVKPAPFPAIPASSGTSAALETIPLLTGLPAPVERFYRLTYSERVPVITSAVIMGRATIRPVRGGPALPARFRFIHEAGRNYRHYIEATWFALPILRVNESYLGGVSRIELPWQKSEGNKQTAQAANLELWAETTSMPAVFLTDPRVRWQAVDDTTALLTVPFGEAHETFVVRFDSASGHPTLLESMRFKVATGVHKTLWSNQLVQWANFGGPPCPASAPPCGRTTASPGRLLPPKASI